MVGITAANPFPFFPPSNDGVDGSTPLKSAAGVFETCPTRVSSFWTRRPLNWRSNNSAPEDDQKIPQIICSLALTRIWEGVKSMFGVQRHLHLHGLDRHAGGDGDC